MTRLLGASLLAASAALFAAQPAAANLLGNGSFETPSTLFGEVPDAPGEPWVGFGFDQERFTTDAEFFDGFQSLKTFGPFGGLFGGVGATQVVPATPGKAYTAEIEVLQQVDDALQGDNFGVIKLEFLDESGGLVGGPDALLGFNVTESPQFTGASPVGEWTTLGTGGVAPEGTASVQVVLVQVQLGDGDGNQVGGAIFWDDATLIESDPVDPLVPGDFNGDGRVDNGDLNLLLGSWGDATVPPEWVNGFEGTVDNGELNALLGDWGAGAGTPVPEPTGLLLAAAGLVVVVTRR